MIVAVGGLVAFSEGIELIGEREHEVPRERVILYFVDIVGRNLTLDAIFLLQQVVDLEQ